MGPAGTGKSATITEVIEVAKDLKLSVELMAPTREKLQKFRKSILDYLHQPHIVG